MQGNLGEKLGKCREKFGNAGKSGGKLGKCGEKFGKCREKCGTLGEKEVEGKLWNLRYKYGLKSLLQAKTISLPEFLWLKGTVARDFLEVRFLSNSPSWPYWTFPKAIWNLKFSMVLLKFKTHSILSIIWEVVIFRYPGY